MVLSLPTADLNYTGITPIALTVTPHLPPPQSSLHHTSVGRLAGVSSFLPKFKKYLAEHNVEMCVCKGEHACKYMFVYVGHECKPYKKNKCLM